ncbi:MAG: hypothetical protein KA218_01725 [Arenimonas sp.]|nr:hypothetical protein [Arenimonas sp.]
MKEFILDTLENVLAPIFILIVIGSTVAGLGGGALFGFGGGIIGGIVGLIQGLAVGAITVGGVYLLIDIRNSLNRISLKMPNNETHSN